MKEGIRFDHKDYMNSVGLFELHCQLTLGK